MTLSSDRNAIRILVHPDGETVGPVKGYITHLLIHESHSGVCCVLSRRNEYDQQISSDSTFPVILLYYHQQLAESP